MIMGFETYIDVESADKIIGTLFRLYDELRVYWSVLDNQEKERYISSAFDKVDSLYHLCGRFGKEIPFDVKKAICYEAVGIMNDDIKSTSEKQSQALRSFGVLKNLKLDATSARFLASTETATVQKKEIPLSSKRAHEIMKGYSVWRAHIRL